MKKKFWIFLLSCLLIVGLCTGLVNCSLIEKVEHEIKYIVDGELYFTQKIYSASEISIPADPSRVDYDFAGWYYDEDTWQRSFDIADLGGGLLDKNIVVYAKWVPHQHVVSNGELTKVDGKFCFVGSCDGCGLSYDANVTPKETVIKRATCLSEGSSKYTYTLLGVDYTITETTPKSNHSINSVDIDSLVDENGYLPIDIDGVHVDGSVDEFKCGDTAIGMFVCSDCGGFVDVIVVRNHKFDEWAIVSVGNADNQYYELSSTCQRSDCRLEYSYAAEERFLSEEITVEPSCKSEGVKTITYNNEKITVTLDVTLAKTAHIYNGIPIDQYATTNGSYNYYDEDGNPVFENNFANIDTAECGKVYDTYFDCECGGVVKITVFKNHRLDDGVEINAATCTTAGLKKYSCADCDYTREEIIKAKGHEYNYTLTRMEDDDNDYTNDVFSYVGACKYCGETNTAINVNYNDSGLKHTIEPASCTTTGAHIYKYGSATLSIEIPKNDEHILNGVIAKYVYCADDGSYKYSIDGIEILANIDYECSVHSGKVYAGYYYCEACAGIVLVDVFVDHLGNRTTVSQPTCNADGTVRVNCIDCGDNQITSIVATGVHKYEHSIKIEQSVETLALTYLLESKCSVCSHTLSKELEPSDLKIEIKTEPSCKHKGVLSYTYVNGDITAYAERVFAEKGEHSLNGTVISELLNSKGYLESSVEGVILPAGLEYKVGDIVEGAFICDECESAVKIKVLIVE